jgi:hypothetical protein
MSRIKHRRQPSKVYLKRNKPSTKHLAEVITKQTFIKNSDNKAVCKHWKLSYLSIWISISHMWEALMIDRALAPSGRCWYLVLLELTRDILDATPKVGSVLIRPLIAHVFAPSGWFSGQKRDGGNHFKYSILDYPTIPPLRSTQPPIQWVPGHSRG